jgi:molybdate transport system ATP-binding protein
MTLTVDLRKQLQPDFTLEVHATITPGITIVFGASGSGKTTLLRCIAGLARPDAGYVRIDDRRLFDAAERRDEPPWRRNVGYVFQQLALFPHMSVAANLAYGLPHLDAAAAGRRIAAVAESFHIAHTLDRRPGSLSGGERQRVALARALVLDPAVLLLDEPLSALDHATQSRIIDDLRAWNAAHRIPILYVTHAHREVFALGERVLVLDRGRVIASGIPEDVLEAPAHETVAQLAGFENFFTATIVERRRDAGVMHCRLEPSGAEIEVPLGIGDPGALVRIAIRAGDILLATAEPKGLSARNVLRGHIAGIRREGAMAVVEVDAGGRFVAHVTPGAAASLALAAGAEVWVIVKTHSCRMVSV